ncbi:PHP domain-containing protein [Pseudomonas saliphila]|uniref:PHP domain-containing protein n=1 Tax=Pseudomonas saliphila TaxID=2586906 RepID=UPI00123B334E|nr:PHP domain-containing protein [Pseudomonas saliphila]
MLADLHMHSTASDGSLTPAELMRQAAASGVELIALTDHDCLDGQQTAQSTAQSLGMQWVSGVELSAQWQGHTLHVLGYGFDPQEPGLVEAINKVQEGRWRRAEQIAQRLAGKNMPGALEGALAVQRSAGAELHSPPARPHFADWMVNAGHVRDRSEAFRKWLGAGKLGDIKQHWPELAEAIQPLRDAGGVAVMAHPWHYGFTRSRLRRLLRDFAEAGGRGIEVVNGKQPPEQVAYLAKLSVEFGFFASCGSDFHHPDSPWMALGRMTAMPPECTPVWADPQFCR